MLLFLQEVYCSKYRYALHYLNKELEVVIRSLLKRGELWVPFQSGDLCCDEVDCRIWIYQGKEYIVPPKAMIIEAILKEVYGGNVQKQKDVEYSIPLNLKKFYDSMKSKMKTLKIEWKHLDVKGDTCDRCYDTGENLTQEVKRLNRILQPQGVTVELLETRLDDTQIPESNVILFNGVPIEKILDIKISKNYCESCTALLETETYCRTIMFEGNEYEDVPAKAIRQAAYKALGLKEQTKQLGNAVAAVAVVTAVNYNMHLI